MSWFSRSTLDTSKLPPGDLGASVVGNTFTFHQDAQSLILSNLRKYAGTPIIRAKVIGRDVALVVDHTVASAVLDSSNLHQDGQGHGQTKRTGFSHREAYKQLIATFFSEPNILLEDEDEPGRKEHRSQWDAHLSKVLDDPWSGIESHLKSVISNYREKWIGGSSMDIYTACKDLSHDLIFQLFLGISRMDDPELFERTLSASDISSRGQFAIPVKASLGGMFESTYSRGLRAQQGFNAIVSDRVSGSHCPFLQPSSSSGISKQSQNSHTSMFSSSLVIKALSSYLTFAFLQLSVHFSANIDHLLLETERLSPPIIGVLRRVLDTPWRPTDDLEIPVGWDTWLYFPLINRDQKVYGDDANLFRPERWEETGLAEPMTFGRGSKVCLGKELVRRIGRLVLQEVTKDGVRVKIEGEVERSVQDFLGWVDDEDVRKEGWKGVKQLPVQRPREVVKVRFER